MSQAATNQPPAYAEPATRTNGIIQKIDQSQKSISEQVDRAGDRLDLYLEQVITPKEKEPSELLNRFLGDRRLQEETRGSRLVLAPSVQFADGEGVHLGLKFSAKLDLDRLKNRLQLVVNNIGEDRDVLQDFTDVRSREEHLDEEDESSASLRWMLASGVKFRLGADAGFKFNPEPEPKVRTHARFQRDLGAWLARLTETVFWERDDGFGEKTQLRFSRIWPKRWLFLSNSAAVWSETSEGVDLGHSFAFHRLLKKHHTIGVKTGVAGHTRPSAIVDVYSLRFPYRKQLKREWIYLEVEPGADFPNEKDFDFSPLITIQFDFILGRVPESD